MGLGDLVGDARVDPTNPRAQAVCDRCGRWTNLYRLIKQQEYRGTALQWTGYKVCHRCLDKPQAQLKAIILPPDPVPVREPRTEPYIASGFQLTLGFDQGELDPTAPFLTPANALAASVLWSPVPASTNFYGGSIATANLAQSLVPVNANRDYLLIYNPSSAPFVVSFGAANYDNVGIPQTPTNALPPSIVVGPAALLVMSPSSTGTVNPGSMTILCDLPNIPFYAWDNP